MVMSVRWKVRCMGRRVKSVWGEGLGLCVQLGVGKKVGNVLCVGRRARSVC